MTFEKYVFKSSREKAREDVRSFIHKGIQNAYEDLKHAAPNEGITRIYVAIQEMKKHIVEVESKIAAWKHSGINPVQIAVKEFNYLLMNDLPCVLSEPGTRVLSEHQGTCVLSDLGTSNSDKMSLYSHLLDMVQFFNSKFTNLKEQALPVNDFFVDTFKAWLKEQHEELSMKADNAITAEQWSPADPHRVFSSHTVRALFAEAWNIVEEILKYPGLGLYNNLKYVAKIVRNVVLKYLIVIQKEFVLEFQNAEDTEWSTLFRLNEEQKKHFPRNISISVTTKLCVIMSNLEASQKMLLTLDEQIGSQLTASDTLFIRESIFQSAYKSISAEKKAQLKAIQNAIAKDLSFCLSWYQKPNLKPQEREGPFFCYLQYIVDKFHDDLDPTQVFHPLLVSIFNCVINEITKMTRPDFFELFDHGLDYLEKGSLLVELTEATDDFFDGNGEGLSERLRNKNLSHLRMLLQFYVSKTEMIIATIKQGEKVLGDLGVELNELLDVLQTRHDSKEAWAIVKEHRPTAKKPIPNETVAGKVASWFDWKK